MCSANDTEHLFEDALSPSIQAEYDEIIRRAETQMLEPFNSHDARIHEIAMKLVHYHNPELFNWKCPNCDWITPSYRYPKYNRLWMNAITWSSMIDLANRWRKRNYNA